MIDVIIPKGTLVEVFSDSSALGNLRTNDFYTKFIGRQYVTKNSVDTNSARNEMVNLRSISDEYQDARMFAWRIRPVMQRLESESEEL